MHEILARIYLPNIIYKLIILFILGLLRAKDMDYALLLEEKMSLQLRLLAATDVKVPLPNPDYTRLVSEHSDPYSIWSEVCRAIKVFLLF